MLGQIGVFMPDHAVIDKLVPLPLAPFRSQNNAEYGARRLLEHHTSLSGSRETLVHSLGPKTYIESPSPHKYTANHSFE